MYNNYDIPNRINQSSQCCIYCGKPYKSRLKMDNHMIFCELVYKTTKNRKKYIIDDIYDETPSQKNMYKAIIALTKQIVNLEEKVENMNKFIVKTKKRMNIIEWLNINIKPDIVFERLIDKIVVTENDINYLFKNTVHDTFNYIFDKTLYVFKKDDNSNPLFAFIQKPNVLYVYLDQENPETLTCEWQELNKNNIIEFLYKIHSKILIQLYDWKQKRKTELKHNEHLLIDYDKTMLKLMSVDFKKDATFTKFRSIIYQNMKTDFKGLVEYDGEV
jgi:hypothetical protein